jgi:hypothetical protein
MIKISNNLEQIEVANNALQAIQPENVPPEFEQEGNPAVAIDFLQRQVTELQQVENTIQATLTNANAVLINKQNLMNQQQAGETAPIAPVMSKSKRFNLKTAQMAPPIEQPELKPEINVPMEPTMSDMNFRTANDLKDWIDNFEDRSEAERELMELVPDNQKEIIVDAMEEYFESDLTEEQRLEIAVKLWPILPDIVKEDNPDIQENIMDFPYVKAEDIEKLVKETESQIKKMASQDVKISKKFNLQKTAQQKSMENVILFGPQQTYVDPFLRQPASDWSLVERNKGFGLVVDDVWNIDWESVWRGNIMDKYSRPYRDKDGKWVGGYIQKRFEVDKWIPEKNNMQLLPGQRRKPRLPEQGVIEGRLEAMRAKNERGYEPNSTGEPYDWDSKEQFAPISKTASFNLKKKLIAQHS